jgi:catechol 2,3-dioxygenase-like lactoylglutathione lyase family enzyme
MGIAAIDHWVIIVKDLDKSVAFYRKLGLKETWQGKAGGESSRPVFRINDTQLIKFYAADRYEIESPSGAPNYAPGSMDFCLAWDGTVQDLLDFLKGKDIPVRSGPSPRSGGRGQATSVYVRDPDDNLIELMSYEAR